LLYILMDVSSVVVLKKLLRTGISPLILSNVSFIIAFLVIYPTLLIFNPGFSITAVIQSLSLTAHAGVWYMALISGTLAYALRGKGQKSIEISEGALFGYLQSVFSAPLAVLLLNEPVTPLFMVGAIIIVIGIFIAEKKPRK
jgi:drug/metabolite transporter (DMT)-like permease